MRSNKRISDITTSLLAMLAALLLIVLVKNGLTELGIYISHFEGTFTWSFLDTEAGSFSWSRRQVLALYFLPWLGMLFIYLMIPWRNHYPRKISLWWYYFKGWVYMGLTIVLFVLPLQEIIWKNGIYYALSWMNMSYFVQLTLAIIAFLLFVYKALAWSSMIAPLMVHDSDQPVLSSHKFQVSWSTMVIPPLSMLIIALPSYFLLSIKVVDLIFLVTLLISVFIAGSIVRKFEIIVR